MPGSGRAVPRELPCAAFGAAPASTPAPPLAAAAPGPPPAPAPAAPLAPTASITSGPSPAPTAATPARPVQPTTTTTTTTTAAVAAAVITAAIVVAAIHIVVWRPIWLRWQWDPCWREPAKHAVWPIHLLVHPLNNAGMKARMDTEAIKDTGSYLASITADQDKNQCLP